MHYFIVYNSAWKYSKGGSNNDRLYRYWFPYQVLPQQTRILPSRAGRKDRLLCALHTGATSSVPYISYVETGKKQIGVEYLVRIAEVLNVSVDGLLMGNSANDKESALEMLDELFRDTSPYEKAIIIETARSAKQTLRKYSTLTDGIK